MMKDLHGVNVVMLFALEDVNYGVKSFHHYMYVCMLCMYVWH
jgi:hypothetical protein